MAFLDNASHGEDGRNAEFVRSSAVRAQISQDQGEEVDLVEVTVRYKRMSLSYEEIPIIVPRETLKNLFALAESFLTYPTLHIDAVTGNAAYKKRVALTPCRELLMIEVTYRDHEPEQNQDDKRRASLRGRRASHVTSVDESQMGPDPMDKRPL